MDSKRRPTKRMKTSTGVSSSQNYRPLSPLKVRPEDRARMDAEVMEIRRKMGTYVEGSETERGMHPRFFVILAVLL